MTDIVERLRARREFITTDYAHWYMTPHVDSDCAEAADEIERLRAALIEAEDELSSFANTNSWPHLFPLLKHIRAALHKDEESPLTKLQRLGQEWENDERE